MHAFSFAWFPVFPFCSGFYVQLNNYLASLFFGAKKKNARRNVESTHRWLSWTVENQQWKTDWWNAMRASSDPHKGEKLQNEVRALCPGSSRRDPSQERGTTRESRPAGSSPACRSSPDVTSRLGSCCGGRPVSRLKGHVRGRRHAQRPGPSASLPGCGTSDGSPGFGQPWSSAGEDQGQVRSDVPSKCEHQRSLSLQRTIGLGRK